MSKEIEALIRLEHNSKRYKGRKEDSKTIFAALKKTESPLTKEYLAYENKNLREKVDELIIEHKALDVIKEKGVNIRLLKETDNVMEYNELIKLHYGMLLLSTEEYDLLKEVLNNESSD